MNSSCFSVHISRRDRVHKPDSTRGTGRFQSRQATLRRRKWHDESTAGEKPNHSMTGEKPARGCCQGGATGEKEARQRASPRLASKLSASSAVHRVYLCHSTGCVDLLDIVCVPRTATNSSSRISGMQDFFDAAGTFRAGRCTLTTRLRPNPSPATTRAGIANRNRVRGRSCARGRYRYGRPRRAGGSGGRGA